MAEPPPAPTPPPEVAGQGGGAFRHYVGLALLMVVLAAVTIWGVRTCQAMLNEQVAGVKQMFAEVFNLRPEIRVNSTVVFGQTSPIEELAVVKREQLVEMTIQESMQIWSTPVPMTGKQLDVRAIYRIKAGFDLSQPFVVTIDPATSRITARLPRAEILSVERVGPLTMKEEVGWLARISSQEREELLNKLQETARASAESSGLVDEAQNHVVERLETLAQRNGQELSILPGPVD